MKLKLNFKKTKKLKNHKLKNELKFKLINFYIININYNFYLYY